jgi:hypothetical protein
MDIERLKEKYTSCFTVGENITITEKVDGANASIKYNPETDELEAFSRKNKLDGMNTLRGFWNFVMTLDKNAIKDVTENGRYIIFGEWLVNHTIHYPDEVFNNFYMFDMYDTETENYLPWKIVKETADTLGLKTVPLFFDGKFESWEKVHEYVGRTELNAEPSGEGIVIKSQDRLSDKNNRIPIYVKIVAEKFSEVHKSKPHVVDPEKLAKAQAELEKASTVVTPRRVEKIIQKMIDEEIIPAEFDEHDFGTISKTIPRLMYEDCVKEEPETVYAIENFGKLCAKLSMQYVREMVK